MANGFLSRNGKFTEAYNYNHFEEARRLLAQEGIPEPNYPISPTDVLCNQCGYLYLREHYNGLAGGIREEEWDSVWLSNEIKLSEEQCEWIANHIETLSDRQKDLLKEIVER